MLAVLLALAVLLIILLSFALYQKITNAICMSKRRLEGKTVVVTGGTAGIGLEIASDLADRGARVIIACPFEDEGNKARDQIINKTKNDQVIFKILDLASLECTRKFAKDILNTEKRLDILINNAGIGFPVDYLTTDSINFVMQVNYYGTFLLTILLLPLLKKTGTPEEASRILTTASSAHWFGQVDLGNANRINYWYKVQIYSNSKIFLVYFANELAKKLKGSNVVINSVDPGVVGTRIYDSINGIVGPLITLLFSFLFKTPWYGSQTALHVALDAGAGLVSGAYFRNCEIVKPAARTNNVKVANMLWESSVRLVKLTDKELDQCL